MRWAVADEEEARKMASADETTSPVPEANGGSSGEFVLKKLFAEFVAVSEKKLEHVCSQPLVNVCTVTASHLACVIFVGSGILAG